MANTKTTKKEDVEAVESTPKPKKQTKANQKVAQGKKVESKPDGSEDPGHTAQELAAWAKSLDDREADLDEREAQLSERQHAIDVQEKSMKEAGKETPPLPEEEVARARDMMRKWRARGHVEKAYEIRTALEEGRIPPNRLLSLGTVKPQKDVRVSERDIPPRNGKGSDQKSWREFALKVSNTDESVLERMSRDDIVNLLEVEEIIPKEPAKEN